MYFNLIHEFSDSLVDSGKQTVHTLTETTPGSPLDRTVEGWAGNMNIDRENDPVAGLGLWGDAAAFNTRDALYVLLFNILTGRLRDRFVLCVFSKGQLCKCGCFGRCTFEAIWEVISWSLRACLTQVYPKFRHDGVAFQNSNRIGDAKRAQWAEDGRRTHMKSGVVQKRGDWSWYKQVLNLVGWKTEGQQGNICFKCQANTTDYPWTDFAMTAAWRTTLLSHAQFMMRLRMAGFVSGYHIFHIVFAS